MLRFSGRLATSILVVVQIGLWLGIGLVLDGLAGARLAWVSALAAGLGWALGLASGRRAADRLVR